MTGGDGCGSGMAERADETFWRTSCFQFFVARKYKVQRPAAVVVEATPAKLGLARFPIGASGFPSRMKKIHPPRRRIPVAFLDEPPATVKMRHTCQNLGSVVAEIQPVQNQRI
jgi:hypothetical protein